MTDELILVDFEDHETGSCEKLKAHKDKLLHRAFSIFIYDGSRLLIQKRAQGKYHSSGLWANTCCSHPRRGESLQTAVHRRLQEEVGLDCPLQELFSFIYYAPFANGLAEYELDHVFLGICDKEPRPNPEEIEVCKWISPLELEEDMRKNPDHYAAWFHIAAPRVLQILRESGRQ